MGNKLCCQEPQIQHYRNEIDYELKSSKTLNKIEEFINMHPNIKQALDQIKTNEIADQLQFDQYQNDKKKFHENHYEYTFEDGLFFGSEPLQNKQKSGFGIMLYNPTNDNDAIYYEGYWMDDLKETWGILICENGDEYYGGWKIDMPNGKGYLKSEKMNMKYYGEWLEGEKFGKGKEIYKDGSYYEGQFKNNQIEGEGIFVSKRQRYEGSWKNGKMNGTGRSEWYNDEGNTVASYIGQYKDGKKDGFGQYTDSKGITYKTTWVQGQMKNNCLRTTTQPAS